MEAKAILWCRVSTNKQEVESQKEDLVKYALSDGYKEENLIPIEAWGASAIKEDELYRQEKDRLLNLLETDKSIDAVYIWEVSRLARKQSTFHLLKDYLVANSIQLAIYSPTYKLLMKDQASGKMVVNDGVVVGISMLAAFAEQEGIQKGVRTSRGRARNKKAGKFNGGPNGTLYGYEVDEGGYIIPNTEEAKVVKDIFKEYATGKYSVKSLVVELKARGYTLRNGKKITDNNLNNILKNPIYAGLDDERKAIKAIISKALYKKVQAVLQGNSLGITKTKEYRHIHLGSGILKCKHCGYGYTYSTGKYTCYKHSMAFRFDEGDKCKDSVGISQPVTDSILWEVAKELEVKFIEDAAIKNIPQMREEVEVLIQKRNNTEERIKKLHREQKRNRELYEEGDKTREEYDQKKAKIQAEFVSIGIEREELNKKINTKLAEITVLEKFPKTAKAVADSKSFDTYTDKDKKELVVKHILTATVESKVDTYGRKYAELLIFTKNETIITFHYYYTLKDRARQVVRI